MSDPAADPHYVGCSIPEEKVKERLNSSASISDLSEATSDMSLSTSPGSDNPSHQQKAFMNISVSPASASEASCYKPQQTRPRKRLVVRQLSSNPYLASSEMSPSEDHALIMGSHSYAAGDSKLYPNGNTVSTDYYEMFNSQRANSYPLTCDCVEGSEEEEDNDERQKVEVQNTVISHIDSLKDRNNSSKISNPRHDNHIEDIHHELNTNSQDINMMMESLGITGVDDVTEAKYPAHHQQQAKKDQEQHHFNHQNQQHIHHHSQQQHHQFYRNTNFYAGNSTNFNSLANKVNGFSWTSNQNELYTTGSIPPTHNRTRSQIHQTSTNSGPPKSREINTWGHFHKPSESHYKYRRSHYNSSDSDEDNNAANNRLHVKQTNNRLTSACKLCKPSCKCKHPNSPPSQSPCMHQNNLATSQPLSTSEKKNWCQKGVKPEEFKDRFQLMKRWFSECNDGQKNIVLKGLLSLCELPQLHLLSVHMSNELHHGCPSNCEDIITWLPRDLATKLMSYLDPVSLCRSAQVCRVWRELAEDQSLWRRFCCQTKWRLSKAAEHKQVISHMSPEGSIQWKNVFAERFRLRNNWLKGRCTVRTFEGHLQGISCVQFDDSRIVSGSSDKTIKVWNMRTNAPWSVQTLMGHHGTVRCLHLDGNRLVSGSCDTTIKVWDLSTQDSWSSIACKVTMTGHSDTVRCLQADDDKVMSGSYDKTLKIWDLKSGELRRTLRGHQASVLCVHFSETKIVSGSADKTIKVWNYDGRCIMTLQGHQDAVTCLMFDSTRIVSGSLDHNLKFWDIHSGECLNTIDWKKAEGHTDVVRCLQADSWRVVSAADDKTIKVWNLVTGERLVTLRNHTDGVTCLQFNDFIIVSGSYDKSVKLWDFSSC